MNTKRILSLILSVALLVVAILSFSSCKKKEHQHTFAEEWSTDATNHWHAATCEHTDEKSELAAHVDANADQKCDACAYAMPKQGGSSTNTPTQKPAAPTPVDFTVTVVNSKGEPVQGVKVKLIDVENATQGDGVVATDTDADGKVVFNVLPKAGWLAQVMDAPAGYASEREDKVVAGADTEDTSDDVTLSFVKQYEFDASNNVTITLVDAPIEEDPAPAPEGGTENTTPDEGTENTDPAE